MSTTEVKSIEEQIKDIGAELMARGFKNIELLKKGQKIPKEEEETQEELWRQLNYIEKAYTRLKKMNQVSGKPEGEFVQDLFNKIKDSENSIGSIVAQIPAQVKEESDGF